MRVIRINIYRERPNIIRRVVDVDGVENQLDAIKTLRDWFCVNNANEESIDHINGDMWRFTQEFEDDNERSL